MLKHILSNIFRKCLSKLLLLLFFSFSFSFFIPSFLSFLPTPPPFSSCCFLANSVEKLASSILMLMFKKCIEPCIDIVTFENQFPVTAYIVLNALIIIFSNWCVFVIVIILNQFCVHSWYLPLAWKQICLYLKCVRMAVNQKRYP